MKKHLLVAGILFLFIISSITPLAFGVKIQTSKSIFKGITLYVGGSGPGNYTKIQDAIENVTSGDTVFVYNGTYYENLGIQSSINLIGEDKNTTIIDGNELGDCINVSSNYVTIRGFIIQNSGNEYGDAGIDIKSNNNIINNTITSNNEFGIRLYESSSNIITDNTISNNGDGIALVFSGKNTITGNVISNNDGRGINLVYSDNNIISDNTITLNHHSGIDLWDSSSNNIQDNNISSNNHHGLILTYCFKNIIIDNNIITNSENGIFLRDSIINNIKGNNVSNNEYSGIILYEDSRLNTIINNIINSNSRHGIRILNSNNNTITINNFISNKWDGIYLYNSSNNTIIGNNFNSNNDFGICLDCFSSNNNTIYHNNFIKNTLQNAYDIGDNIWDNGYPSCGNYWDDYSGIDNNEDGIGDTPYPIPGSDNEDRFPLMESYDMTKLTIGIISGLFKFSGYIKNIGNKTAFNVQWRITVKGGFILLGRNSSGIIPKPLLPDEETTIVSFIIFGFGQIIITIEVWADNAPKISISNPGFLFLLFIII